LAETIGAVKVEIDYEGHQPDLDWEPYDTVTTAIVRQILHNILENIKQHAAVRDARAKVRITRGTWGGREEDLVIFQNRPNQRIDENITRNLYRVPRQVSLADEAGAAPRIGAFLAGRLARSLNGELSATVTGRGELRTTLAIPTHDTNRATWLLANPRLNP
jgi:hypothetical protein